MSKTIWVTGAEGFIGGHLIELLDGNVVGTYLKNPRQSYLSTVEHQAVLRRCDITSKEEVKRVLQDIKPDLVFNLAAQPIVVEGVRNPHYT